MFENKAFREFVLWPTYLIALCARPFLPIDHPWSYHMMGYEFYSYEGWVECASELNVQFGLLLCLCLVINIIGLSML